MDILSRYEGLAAIAALLLTLAVPVRAQLASPGKLSRSHASLEGVNNCAKCHNFGEKSFRNNCLACHGEIRSRIDAGRGYHYFTRKLECAKCHKEHHGREFELVRWDPSSFDHKQTGFLLEGGHAGLDCRRCHRSENIKAGDIRKKGRSVLGKTFLGLSTSCENCHEDEHRGQLKDCAECHTMTDWKQTTFTHDRARFRLEGRHTLTACGKCHPVKDDGKKRNGDTKYLQFRGLSFAACTDCHEDHHRGSFGKDCTQCHTPADWKRLRIAEGSFDHAKTSFPLEGKHAGVGCTSCHAGGDFARFKKADLSRCGTCHSDYHAGQFAGRPGGTECSGCHSVSGFSPSLFETAQHAQSRFPLQGAHEAIPCGRCHAPVSIEGKETPRFRWTDLHCATCHRDPHAGQFENRIAETGCESCHQVDSWHVMQFDHADTRFPLLGKHRDVLCERCHRSGTVNGQETMLFRFDDLACAACHEDRHRGQFTDAAGAVDCARCHDPYGWSPSRFDHAVMSRFALSGRHAGLACERCHPVETDADGNYRRYRPLDSQCSACHTTGR